MVAHSSICLASGYQFTFFLQCIALVLIKLKFIHNLHKKGGASTPPRGRRIPAVSCFADASGRYPIS